MLSQRNHNSHSIILTMAKNVTTAIANLIGITNNGYFIELIESSPYKIISLSTAKQVILQKEPSTIFLTILDENFKQISYQLDENITLNEGMVNAKKFTHFFVSLYPEAVEVRGMNRIELVRRTINEESDKDDAYESSSDISLSDQE